MNAAISYTVPTRAEPLPRSVGCHGADCDAVFATTPEQRQRIRRGLAVYCSRACRPKPGPKPGSSNTNPGAAVFLLGAFVHGGLSSACVCRKPATHLAAALYQGRIAAVPVCADCAGKA